MIVEFSVDLISDLNLTKDDNFDWEGKATSLYCCVCGNVSDDDEVFKETIIHLSTHYLGVMFVEGSLEHHSLVSYDARVKEIKAMFKDYRNIIYLHNHVVILNGVAFVGSNGFYGNRTPYDNMERLFLMDECRLGDIDYLSKTVETLQDHPEVKSIAIVTNSLPTKLITNNDPSVQIEESASPAMCLINDHKGVVNTWMFGAYKNMVDSTYNGRRFVNNPYKSNQPYWPKRIVL